jgi:hypothetical protein
MKDGGRQMADIGQLHSRSVQILSENVTMTSVQVMARHPLELGGWQGFFRHPPSAVRRPVYLIRS